jgi:hypothetical protein
VYFPIMGVSTIMPVSSPEIVAVEEPKANASGVTGAFCRT